MRIAGSVRAEPHLHPAKLVFNMREGRATQIAQLHDPARHRNHRTIRSIDVGAGVVLLVCVEQPARLIHGCGGREVNAVRGNPTRGKFVDLAAPFRKEIVGRHADYLLRQGTLRVRDASPQGVS